MSAIITVRPRAVAVFRAVQWSPNDPEATHLVGYLASLAGWEVSVYTLPVTGVRFNLTRRGKSPLRLMAGQWLVSVGGTTLRVMTAREFRAAYEEVPQRGPESPSKAPGTPDPPHPG